VSSIERIPPTSVDPTVKNFHWGDLLRGQYEAFECGARLAVLVDGAGNLTEGAGFNLFALVAGALLTPATGVLDGITRRTILELAEREGLEARACVLPVVALERADEVFLTSTAGGVMPVTTVDGRQVGSGEPGPVTRRLSERYWEAHSDPRYATPVAYD
jgi:branched-chain amino acid aminotransferase